MEAIMNEPAINKNLDFRIQSNPETGLVVKIGDIVLPIKEMNMIMEKLQTFVSNHPEIWLGLAGLAIGKFLLPALKDADSGQKDHSETLTPGIPPRP
jgi:hypothetical protein